MTLKNAAESPRHQRVLAHTAFRLWATMDKPAMPLYGRRPTGPYAQATKRVSGVLQLVFKDDRKQEQTIPLEAGLVVTVGRNPGSSIRTKSPSVSRKHAEIQEEGGDWILKDLGSSNHSFVNDIRVARSVITAGDAIRFGDFAVRVQGVVGGAKRARPERPERAPAAEPSLDRPTRDRPTRDRPTRDRPTRDRPTRDAVPDPKAAPPERARPERPRPSRDRAAPAAAARLDRARPERARPERGAEAAPVAAPDRARPSRGPQVAERARPERVERSRPARAERPAAPERAPSPSKDAGKAAAKAASSSADESREARRASARLKNQLSDSSTRVEELTARVEELETRESRFEDELDGWHERYNRAREQLDHSQELVDRTREELQEATDQKDALQARVETLETEHTASEGSRSNTRDLMSDLKSRIVQKDRRLDVLQRELDDMEFDLRSSREELESYEDRFNHDNSEQRRFEREKALLREVNAEKENVIQALKLEIEDQSREIYDLKMGTGVKDLEEARSEVLEKYFEKNREVDELRAQLKGIQNELDASSEERGALEERINEKRDITVHPDYLRKVRELERIQEDLDEAQGANEKAEQRLEEYGPEARAKLEAELNFLQRKNRALQDKLDETAEEVERLEEGVQDAESEQLDDLRAEVRVAKERIATLADELEDAQETAAGAAPNMGATGQIQVALVLNAEAGRQVSEALDSYASLKTNINLIKSYMDDASEAIAEDASQDDVSEAVESVRELLTVVLSDASSLRRELKDLEELVES